MLKLITGVATLLLVVGAMIFTMWDGISVPDVRHSQSQGALRTYVDLAKARGESRITKPGPVHVEYGTKVKSLKSTFKHNWVVVARPVEKRSRVGLHDEIWTWFKLQVTDRLTPRKYSPCADCPRPASVPDELLPLGPDAVFKVNPDESLSALTEHPHMLKQLVKDQYRDSLRELTVAAQNQQ
jgi:hypothetical protein